MEIQIFSWEMNHYEFSWMLKSICLQKLQIINIFLSSWILKNINESLKYHGNLSIFCGIWTLILWILKYMTINFSFVFWIFMNIHEYFQADINFHEQSLKLTVTPTSHLRLNFQVGESKSWPELPTWRPVRICSDVFVFGLFFFFFFFCQTWS